MNPNEPIKPLLIETQYWGTVSYYRLMCRHRRVWLERREHFAKSTYRNRAYIATPEGRHLLSIPLTRGGRTQRRTIDQVSILNVEPWQRTHWRSLCYAYRSSPYFEYYEDRIAPFYHEPQENLYNFNRKLIDFIVQTLDLPVELAETAHFLHPKQNSEFEDARSRLRPNKPLPESVKGAEYHQVFADRHGFLEDLCILDLLFNEGPNAIERLR